MIGKWKVEEFQQAFIRDFFGMEKDIINLTNFFVKNQYKMPNFLERHYEILNYEDDDFALSEEHPIEKVPVNQIYGTSWVFKSMEDKPQDPKHLAHYFLHENPDALPPITVRKITDTRFLLVEGSHQLYTAYLRKWPYVLAEVQAVFQA